MFQSVKCQRRRTVLRHQSRKLFSLLSSCPTQSLSGASLHLASIQGHGQLCRQRLRVRVMALCWTAFPHVRPGTRLISARLRRSPHRAHRHKAEETMLSQELLLLFGLLPENQTRAFLAFLAQPWLACPTEMTSAENAVETQEVIDFEARYQALTMPRCRCAGLPWFSSCSADGVA